MENEKLKEIVQVLNIDQLKLNSDQQALFKKAAQILAQNKEECQKFENRDGI